MPSGDQKQKNISKQIGKPLNYDPRTFSGDNEEKRSAGLKKAKQGVPSDNLSISQNLKKGKQSTSKQSKVKLAKEGIKKKLNVLKLASAGALRFAWTYIWFFGLTVIILDVIVFLQLILPSAFCKLGEEWTMGKQMPATGGGGSSLTKNLGLVEKIGLFLVNIIILLLILAILSIFSMIAEIATNPGKSAGDAIFGTIASWFE